MPLRLRSSEFRLDGANSRMRWTAVASVGVLVATLVLFVMIRRQHSAPATNFVRVAPAPAPSVEKKEVLAAAVTKPAHVGTPKTPRESAAISSFG